MSGKWSDEGMALASLLEDRGLDRRQFAEMMNISEDILSNIVRGITQLRGKRRAKAAVILGITETALLDQLRKNSQRQLSYKGFNPNPYTNLAPKESSGRAVPVYKTGYRLIPVYGSVPAGPPMHSHSDAIEFIEAPEWGSDFDRWGRLITGQSMIDEFMPGDIVVFESRRADLNMAVYAWKEGDDSFKVLTQAKDGMLLSPMNQSGDYDAFSAEGWEVFGVAIERYRMNPFGGRDKREYPHGYVHRFDRT